MLSKTRPRRRVALLIAGIGAGLVASAVALATIPDSGGVIHACYTKSGGGLRVIDDSVTNCKSGETSLNWNVAGQPGPPGPSGVSGLETVTATATLPSGAFGGAKAPCPSGKKPLGGGFNSSSPTGGIEYILSEPIVGSGGPGWEVAAINHTADEAFIVAFAICADVGP